MMGSELPSKKISKSDVIGEQGVAHIRKVVAAMEYLFYETGGVEAGVDGSIEIRDPDTGEVRNRTIQFQSKATRRALKGDNGKSFYYPCTEKEIEYWIFGTQPVILIVVDVPNDIAYWKDLRSWFGVPENRAARRVIFDKATDIFDANAAFALRTVAEAGRPGSYSSAPRLQEALTPNLLKVSAMARTIYWAPTNISDQKRFWAEVREIDPYPSREIVVRGGAAISFHDLDADPWRRVCDIGAMEEFDVSEWAEADDPDRERQFVQLLNNAMKEMVSPHMRFHPKSNLLFFKPRRDGKTRHLPRRRGQTRQGRAVVKRYMKKKDKTQTAYWRHSAFSWQFMRIANDWYIYITPTYHYTRDGRELDRFGSDHLSGIKRFEYNDTVLAQFEMFQSYLVARGETDLLDEGYPFLSLAPLEPIKVGFGIPEDTWDDERVSDEREDDLFA